MEWVLKGDSRSPLHPPLHHHPPPLKKNPPYPAHTAVHLEEGAKCPSGGRQWRFIGEEGVIGLGMAVVGWARDRGARRPPGLYRTCSLEPRGPGGRQEPLSARDGAVGDRWAWRIQRPLRTCLLMSYRAEVQQDPL